MENRIISSSLDIRLLLLKNMTGEDWMNIAQIMGCSISKLRVYLTGYGKNKEDEDKIVAASLSYFAEKYRNLLSDIEAAKLIVNTQSH